jgi:isoamylase
VRDYWREGGTSIGELAERLTGSSDLYQANGRSPFASINFVTAHDGFTLRDLVSYNEKHNDANGEQGRDGTDDNRSWNCGVEGPSDEVAVASLRSRQVRNLLATLMLSQGVPMLLGGDEFGRTQSGNNNAYCQDNPTSWYDWEHVDSDLLDWTGRLIDLRRRHPVFRRRRFFQGRPLRGHVTDEGLPDLAWFRPDGAEMSDVDWTVGYAKSIGVFLNGQAIPDPDEHGRPIVDDTFFLVLNAWDQPMEFTLPGPAWGNSWELVLDTASDALVAAGRVAPAEHRPAGAALAITGRQLIVLRSARS